MIIKNKNAHFISGLVLTFFTLIYLILKGATGHRYSFDNAEIYSIAAVLIVLISNFLLKYSKNYYIFQTFKFLAITAWLPILFLLVLLFYKNLSFKYDNFIYMIFFSLLLLFLIIMACLSIYSTTALRRR